jgi:hypothetical protein
MFLLFQSAASGSQSTSSADVALRRDHAKMSAVEVDCAIAGPRYEHGPEDLMLSAAVLQRSNDIAGRLDLKRGS